METVSFESWWLLAGAWLCGTLALAARRAWQWRALGRAMRDAVSIRRLGRVEILVQPALPGPFACRRRGRAMVVLPAWLVESGGWREAVRHELLHHRRGDTRWLPAWQALTAVWWFNPAVWAWRGSLARLQELACDEQLLGGGRVAPRRYGDLLLDVAARLAGQPAASRPACALLAGWGGSASLLAVRIDRIIHFSSYRRYPMKRWIAWSILGFAVWSLLALALAAGAAAPEAPGAAGPRLNLQSGLQSLAAERLARHVGASQARLGLVVVLDPESGAVLARAGIRRNPAGGVLTVDDDAPFAAHFLGASTMNPLVAACALQSGLVQLDEQFDTGNGTLVLDGRTFREWKEGGLGRLNLGEILVKSSNLGTIQVARRLGAARLAGFLGQLGYRVAKDAPVEEMSCGSYSGVSVSAYDLARAYAVLVNGGTVPETGTEVISAEVSARLRDWLVQAVQRGTGLGARCQEIVVGGKTGTSLQEENGLRTGAAYFVGFAPADHPRLVVSVVLDDLGPEVNGNRFAAPLFREIVEGGLPLLGPAAAGGATGTTPGR